MPSNFVVYFIETNSEDSNDLTHQAFNLISRQIIKKQWISKSGIFEIALKNNDVVVIENFENETFEKLVTVKVIVISASCLIQCFMEKRPIPSTLDKIYSFTMKNTFVTTTGFSENERQIIQRKVEYMSGTYNIMLTNTTTHLIANSVQTVKYAKASELNLKIMLDSWIYSLWDNVVDDPKYLATDEESYLFRHNVCPIFFQLKISVTGLSSKDKSQIRIIIEENGGEFLEECYPKRTNILVCDKLTKPNKKLEAMLQYKIPCVSKQWIFDSVKKGYAVVETPYIITLDSTVSDSVNEKNLMDNKLSETLTLSKSLEEQLDLIFRDDNNVIEKETNNNYMIPVSEMSVDKIMEEISQMNVKQAGLFLDGCSIYLYGFENDHRIKLTTILNIAGAIRYDEMKSSVTHVLVGVPNYNELKKFRRQFQNVFIVKLNWLLKCIESSFPISEEDYLVDLNLSIEPKTPSTPLSKKSLSLLENKDDSQSIDLSSQLHAQPGEFSNHSMDAELRNILVQSQNIDNDQYLLQQYLNAENFEEVTFSQVMNESKIDEQVCSQDCTVENSRSTTNLSESFQITASSKIFVDHKILLHGFPKSSQQAESLSLIITDYGGSVVPKKYVGFVDYAIVPTFNDCDIVLKTCVATQVVNDFWIRDCIEFGKLIDPPHYYHYPITIPTNKQPLINDAIVITNYYIHHRLFLTTLIEKLGGKFQDIMSRQDSQEYLQTTCLICSVQKGDKYEAAIKWNLPIVKPDWLIACAQNGMRVDMKPFLLNKDAVLSPENNKINKVNLNKPFPIVNKQSKQSRLLSNKTKSLTLSQTLRNRSKRQLNFEADVELSPAKKLHINDNGVTLSYKEPTQAYSESQSSSYRSSKLSLEPVQQSMKPPTQNADQIMNQLLQLDQVLNNSKKRREEKKKSILKTVSINDEESSQPFKNLSQESQMPSVYWDLNLSLDNIDEVVLIKSFMISSVDDKEKDILSQMIIDLGGLVSKSIFFDETATHLIIGNQLNRNEKVLCSMISGKWILHKTYIEESWKQKKFLEEHLFQLGNPDLKVPLPIEASSLMKCIYDFNQKIRVRNEKKIFDGFKCIVFSKKAEMIERLIKAGNGIVLPSTPLPIPDSVSITHCFVDIKSMEYFNANDFLSLAKRNVYVVPVDVLNVLITKHDTNVQIVDYILPELKQFYN